MAEGDKPSFETLKASDSGRRLVSGSGRHEVAAKIMRDADGEEFLVLRAWVGSHPGPKSTAEWSEPSWWSHLVLDDSLNLVAAGWGRRERDSFAMTQKALAAKGIHPRGAAPAAASLEASELRADRFTWGPDDIDILSPEEAAKILGWDAEDD